MERPSLEVADIIRTAGVKFIERSRRWLTGQHLKVLRDIVSCRTAALGGHLDQCTRCGYQPISYNSCRNRHCPKCQANARLRWIQGRTKELLPTPYAHVVFTLPHLLAPLALQNKKLVYTLLFRISAETLIEVARNPKRLGAEIGFFSVLHTWNQVMKHHPHVHCVVAAGGLSTDHKSWVRPRRPRFFLPEKVLGIVFRGKFREALEAAFAQSQIGFHGQLKHLSDPKVFHSFVRQLFRHEWVVDCRPPFGGPEHVLRYLGRYTHRVAISNHRLVSLVDGNVTFRWRDRAHGNREQPMTLPADEFLRRFLLHLLPKGFVRIRNFGFLANRRRAALLSLCFQLLGSAADGQDAAEHVAHLWTCPKCGGPMVVVMRFSPAEIFPRSPPPAVDIPVEAGAHA
jgi:predicted Zn-ribbon and HTH transcriptional regulator